MKKIILSIVLFLMAFSIQATETPKIDSVITPESIIHEYITKYANICFYDVETNSTYKCKIIYNKIYMTLDDNLVFTLKCPSDSTFNAIFSLKFYEETEDGIFYTITGLNEGYYGSFLFGTSSITFLLITPTDSFLVLYSIQ